MGKSNQQTLHHEYGKGCLGSFVRLRGLELINGVLIPGLAHWATICRPLRGLVRRVMSGAAYMPPASRALDWCLGDIRRKPPDSS